MKSLHTMRILLKPLLLSGSALQVPLQAAVASGLGESSRSIVDSTEVATPLNTVIIKLLEQQQMSTYTLGGLFIVYALVMVYKSDMMEKKIDEKMKMQEEDRERDKQELQEKIRIQEEKMEREKKEVEEKMKMQEEKLDIKFALTSVISVIALLTPLLMKYFEK